MIDSLIERLEALGLALTEWSLLASFVLLLTIFVYSVMQSRPAAVRHFVLATGAVPMARLTSFEQRMKKILDVSCGRASLSRRQFSIGLMACLFLLTISTCFHIELTDAALPSQTAAGNAGANNGAGEEKSKDGKKGKGSEKSAKLDLKKPRKWNDNTGNFSVVATFVTATNRNVTLRRENGKLLVVPLARLSTADREFTVKAVKQLMTAAANASLEDTLQLQSRLQFTNTPLTDMVSFLQDRYRIPIVVDRRALEDLGLKPDVAISIRGQNVPLHVALTQVLKPHGLTWTVGNEVLMITSKAAAERRLATWAYRVNRNVQLDGLIRNMHRGIAKESWSDVGGPAESVGLSNNILLVSQTPPNHMQILVTFKNQLTRLELKSKKTIHPPGLAMPTKALNSKTTIEFIETPLKDIAAFLSKAHDVKIEIDARSLEEIGLGTDTPLTIALRGISLRSALGLLLKQCGLTWQPVGKDKLVITSPEKAEQTMILVNYPLPGRLQHDEVIEAMTRIVAPESWEEVGGPGSASASNQKIAVKQTVDVHYKIARLLKLMEGG